jgi:hypothetical protein
MRYGFVKLLWRSLLIVLLAITVLGTPAFAGSFSQGSAANRQFTWQGKSALDGPWELSYAPSGQSNRHVTYPLAYVDPGSGQLIWQMLAAACVGGLFYIKRVRVFLGGLVKKWFRKH